MIDYHVALEQRRKLVGMVIKKELPWAIISSQDWILLLASGDRLRIWRALHRVATVGIGPDAESLQEGASAAAKSYVLQHLSYHDVTASLVARDVSSVLGQQFKQFKEYPLEASLVLVSLGFHPEGDEMCAVGYDGKIYSLTSEVFMSGELPHVSRKQTTNDEDELDDVCITGASLPQFKEWLTTHSSDSSNAISIYDIIYHFGECVEAEYGNEVLVQVVLLDRVAACEKQFEHVFSPIIEGPWVMVAPAVKAACEAHRASNTEEESDTHGTSS